ncbi:WecB/TagA/CpsF family glycosyltransferase [Candidatus Beckwithbacteria bacterium]|nr:WecB/TagA/CpsF family glycosyltransferase [Candidatus Beckwithbacteria bacterium]
MNIPSETILGVKISVVNYSNILEYIEKCFKNQNQIQIATPNPEQVIQAQTDSTFKKILNQVDIAIPDGEGVVWAVRKKLKNKKEIERIAGVDLMNILCQLAAKKNFTVGFFGGKGQTSFLAQKNFQEKYSQLKTVIIPAFADINNVLSAENEKIVKQINQNKVDFLFVAYGAPFQEIWIRENLKKMPTVKLAMGVGGAFDFYSGKIKRAPKFLQKLKLEWFYRLMQEPWRLKRQLRLLEFIYRNLF